MKNHKKKMLFVDSKSGTILKPFIASLALTFKEEF